jgi:hypothetical protein
MCRGPSVRIGRSPHNSSAERMTLAELHYRFPSTIPVAEMAVINGVGDRDAVVPAWWLVMRVTEGLARKNIAVARAAPVP